MNSKIEKALTITRKSNQAQLTRYLSSNARQESKDRMAEEILRFEEEYPGGLAAYTSKIICLMEEYVNNKTKYDNVTLNTPKTIHLNWNEPAGIQAAEEKGIPELKKCAFFLLAGGLGERMGYYGPTSCMILDSISGITYLQLYCEYIKAYQDLFGTHSLTN